MKPRIILVDSKTEKVYITKEELIKMLDDIYQEGFEDGKKSIPTISNPIINPPYTFNTTPVKTIKHEPNDFPHPWEITCGHIGCDAYND